MIYSIDFKRLSVILAIAVCASFVTRYGGPELAPVAASLAVLLVGALRSFLKDGAPPSPPMLPLLALALTVGACGATSFDKDDGRGLAIYADALARCRSEALAIDGGAPEKRASYKACADDAGAK